jgi:asparagine synthase (glutamine-hydrolysing)
MCGICGIYAQKMAPEPTVRRMTRSLAHRGPDDEGIYVQGNVALGHRRLSIIDLDAGQQPMSNAAGDVRIVFNGEIYNYRQLQQQLTRDGHRLRTDSDTETILHLYEHYGTDCLQHLRGMFAFAIWDERRGRVFVARDRLGQKPLYYVQRGNELLFASEIKALLAVDPSLRELDYAALDEYLTLRVISSPRSMFRQVRKLPPAHFLTFDRDRGLAVERYWDLSYEPKLRGTDEELLEELERRLVEAIRLHLVSDVPVGAFMSGGLDSTLIVAMLMKHGLAESFKTFSIGLPYGQFDEAPVAQLVADRYGTRHYAEQIKPSLLQALPWLVYQLDEPSDPLAICVDVVSQIARREVKVVLGGDGGDELFGGYDRYFGNRMADYYAMVPAWARRNLVQPALERLPDGHWYKSAGHQLKWLHRLSFYDGAERYIKSLGYFYLNEAFKGDLYGPRMQERQLDFDPGALMRQAYWRAKAKDAVDRMLYADCQSRLSDHPVMIQDRMTMAHGLEARSPFMDHEIAEFAARLPARLKVRGRALRFAQVELAKRYLPPEVLTRKKQGFASALPYLLKDELDLLYSAFLSNTKLAREGLLRQRAIDEMLIEHRQGAADHGNRLWLLLNSEVWFRMFIDGEDQGQISERIQAVAAGEQPAAASGNRA